MSFAEWSPDQDEPWDEHQWEQFMQENDRRVDRYMTLLHDFLQKHPRPESEDARALEVWKEKLRAFVDRKGWTRDDLVLPFLWLEDDFAPEDDLPDGRDDDWGAEPWSDEDDLGWDLPDEAFEEDFGEDVLDPLDDFKQDPLWQDAFELTTSVLKWADTLPGDVKDDTLVEFCTRVTRIPANVAKGHGFGTERDAIGGNIACLKRGLTCANDALALLPHLQSDGLLTGDDYRTTYERVYECRNAIGIRVQDLRDRFDLGID